jgi:hypothetical protein
MTSQFQPTHFYKSYNTHILIQNMQFITVLNSPFIVASDWTIYGPQSLSLNGNMSFSSDVDRIHVPDGKQKFRKINFTL